MNKHRTIQNIVDMVERVNGVTMSQMTGSERTEKVKNARHLLCYLFRTKGKLSVKEIGELVKRDHSTISHCLKRIKGLIEVGDDMVLRVLREANNIWANQEGENTIAALVTTHYTETCTVSLPYPEQYPTVVKVESDAGGYTVFDIQQLNKALVEMGVDIKVQ